MVAQLRAGDVAGEGDHRQAMRARLLSSAHSEATARLDKTRKAFFTRRMTKWQGKYPKRVAWVEETVEDGSD